MMLSNRPKRASEKAMHPQNGTRSSCVSMKSASSSAEAIASPVFSVEVARLGICAAAFAIALLAVFLPATATSGTGLLHSIFQASRVIADPRALGAASAIPVPVSITYAASMLLALINAILSSFARIDLDQLRRLSGGKSLVQRIVLSIGLCTFLCIPYFVELQVYAHQFSFHFFELVANSRIWLLIWSEAVLLGSYAMWLWLLFELSNLLRRS